MADQDNEKKTQEDGSKPPKTSRRRIWPWLIVSAAVLLCAGSGFFLGRIFGRPAKSNQTDPGGQNAPVHGVDGKTGDSAADSKSWYYELDPIVANLDEPGVTRYVRVTLTLEVSGRINGKKGVPFLDEKKPSITNALTIYLASLTLEDIRGDKNLKRIQIQVLDILNETLFPDAKPQIKHILFKEFAVQ